LKFHKKPPHPLRFLTERCSGESSLSPTSTVADSWAGISDWKQGVQLID